MDVTLLEELLDTTKPNLDLKEWFELVRGCLVNAVKHPMLADGFVDLSLRGLGQMSMLFGQDPTIQETLNKACEALDLLMPDIESALETINSAIAAL